ncbi:hypothetical protein [Arcobacter lacus]|uniref:Uncharacterized protein n=1 Tax=Arcobacter lacus TaxID=1912876 RepID=A0ABX5JH38_9BACT|nr:hypothetical protein [Arcobacter lacus]PUE64858.1 hypothetical protein B0175_10660 [Arcobacter lacus]
MLKKSFIGISLVANCLFANEIQVFSAKTLDLKLSKNTQTKEIFCGTTEEFSKKYNEIFRSKLMGETFNFTLDATTEIAKASAGTFSNSAGNLDGGLVTAGLGILTAVGIGAYNKAVEDNEYIYLVMAENEDKKATLIGSLVVSNDKITSDEVKQIASDDQKKLFK